MTDPQVPRPGVYDDLITQELESRLRLIDPDLLAIAHLDPADSQDILSKHLSRVFKRALSVVGHGSDDPVAAQVALINEVIGRLATSLAHAHVEPDSVAIPGRSLQSIAAPSLPPQRPNHARRPTIPLGQSALLVNGSGQPRIGSELVLELESAESVDLICAFLTWYGYRIVRDGLRGVIARGGQVRVLTTTFTGTTDLRVVEDLVASGAKVKVSYDVTATRLHAKAWMFHRPTLSTAFVGSSNLSRTARQDGLEWNVRLTSADQDHLLRAFSTAFEEYWEDGSFEAFEPDRDRDRYQRAISEQRSGTTTTMSSLIAQIDVRPYPYQQEVLYDLQVERANHGRWHSLVVMATGTGKTVVSALDYKRLFNDGAAKTLLFVAHREEILSQSLTTFRTVLRDGSFGELLVGGQRPTDWSHVFASVQSLARIELDALPADRWDMVIIDEFHHAEASTYDRLLKHLRPKVLLGLTATPERADGGDVTRWFGGRIAVELRLWQALERSLLVPFQYFGLADNTDLSNLKWSRGAYDQSDLSRVYESNRGRAALIVEAIRDKVPDARHMRALGFCVSIAHAKFMAEQLSGAGIPSLAVSAESTPEERRAALAALRERSVNVLFAVDLFNEGLDIPNIDTVMLLRPTESATVFLQQIGRGLRMSEGKACLTVLDFIGAQHKSFRFDLRLGALTGTPTTKVAVQVEHGFPMLPPGCHIQLDRVAKEIILTNLKTTIVSPWKRMVEDVHDRGDITLAEFVESTGFSLEDVYRTKGKTWSELLRDARVVPRSLDQAGPDLSGSIRRLLHMNDRRRIDMLRRVASGEASPMAMSTQERRILAMLQFSLWGSGRVLAELTDNTQEVAHSRWREELLQLADALDARRSRLILAPADVDVPLQVHANYTRDEALAAFGFERPGTVREGVKWLPEAKADVFFITINKSEDHFSPSQMYQDRAISPSLFQWESQSTTPIDSPTGQRYVNHDAMGTSVHLFVRQYRDNTIGLSSPYFYAGKAHHRSHRGSRPIEIVWELEHQLPPDVFLASRALAT